MERGVNRPDLHRFLGPWNGLEQSIARDEKLLAEIGPRPSETGLHRVRAVLREDLERRRRLLAVLLA